MNTLHLVIAFLISFAVSFALYKIFIPLLRKVKLGQKILEIGPNWHKCKEGTPVMGGLFFITGMAVSIGVMAILGDINAGNSFFVINICFALMNACIGFIDDYVKLFKKRNQGLTAVQKLVLQAASAGAYLYALSKCALITTSVNIPFSSSTVDLGFFYYIIIGVLIVYIVNTANLTDGLDGLAGSVAFVLAVMFLFVACKVSLNNLAFVETALIGSLAAFLIFNFHPAKIFMGDTGSLFLGAMLVCCAMRVGRPLIMIIAGLVYVFEGLSVMIQVAVFKATKGKKRFFKMAPIHHHFELCGLTEVKIVAMFLAFTAVIAALSYFIIIKL